MGEFNTIMARDGHEFRAYFAAPPSASGKGRGAIVIMQEIFGVNRHIRNVADSYAAEGYVVIAPSVFDRVRRGVELGYTPPDIEQGRGIMQQIKPEQVLKDMAAAIAVVKHAGRVGMVGYCWGGRLTYLAACELQIACGVSYYGGGIVNLLDKKPRKPVMYHFGELDKHIPLSDIEKIRAAHPEGIFHIYPGADHGFNCDERASFNPQAAALARQRTLEFLDAHLRPKPGEEQAEEPAEES